MLCFAFAGKVEVPGDIAEELLQAADQYMLEGLKRLCEVAIARTLSIDSLPAAQEVCFRIGMSLLHEH